MIVALVVVFLSYFLVSLVSYHLGHAHGRLEERSSP